MPQMYVSLLGTYKLWINTLALEIVEPLKADFYNDVFVNKYVRASQATRVGVVACVLGIRV